MSEFVKWWLLALALVFAVLSAQCIIPWPRDDRSPRTVEQHARRVLSVAWTLAALGVVGLGGLIAIAAIRVHADGWLV